MHRSLNLALEKAMARANEMIEKQVDADAEELEREMDAAARGRGLACAHPRPRVRHPRLPAGHHRPASAATRPDATAACKAS